LELDVFVFAEVSNNLGDVLLRREEDTAAQRELARQERDAQVVLIDDVAIGSVGDKGADEAPTLTGVRQQFADVRIHVRLYFTCTNTRDLRRFGRDHAALCT
jgi:hypothetical protein